MASVSRTLTKYNLLHQGIHFLPIDNLHETRQLAVYISGFLHKMNDTMDTDSKIVLKTFMQECFRITAIGTKAPLYCSTSDLGAKMIANAFVTHWNSYIIPVGSKMEFDALLIVFDTIIWNNPDKATHQFISRLKELTRVMANINTVLDGKREQIFFWETVG